MINNIKQGYYNNNNDNKLGLRCAKLRACLNFFGFDYRLDLPIWCFDFVPWLEKFLSEKKKLSKKSEGLK